MRSIFFCILLVNAVTKYREYKTSKGKDERIVLIEVVFNIYMCQSNLGWG